jgi:hypothetical protein
MTLVRARLMPACLLVVACGGGAPAWRSTTPGAPVVKFPPKETLALPSAEPVRLNAALSTVEVERWRIETPVPETKTLYSIETHWDGVLIAALRDPQSGILSNEQAARLNSALRCAASETARFYVENAGYPSEALRNFLLLRCGSTFTAVDTTVWQAVVPDGVPERHVETELEPGVRELVARVTAGNTREVGVGYARGNGRAAVVVYSGLERARIIDYSPVVQGVGAHLDVEVHEPAAFLMALVNQGRLGVKSCEADPSAPPPKYRFFCPLATNDSSARVDIAVRRPNDVLYETVAQALLLRSKDAGLSYEPLIFGADALAADAAAFREALYGALNDARRAAGVPPLAVEARQAAWNDRMALSFFDAFVQNDTKRRTQATLAVLAGWDVDGAIRDAGIFAGILPNERRPARWLSFALESPLGRWVLLERNVARVAVGTAELTTPGIAALVTTYALFEGADHRADEANLRSSLTAKRSALGRKPPTFRSASKELRAALLHIERDGVSAYAALSDAVGAIREDSGETVNGYAVETIDLRTLDWAGELLGPATLDVEIGVTHYKPKGAAWGQYAVLFFIRPTGPSLVASNP